MREENPGGGLSDKSIDSHLSYSKTGQLHISLSDSFEKSEPSSGPNSSRSGQLSSFIQTLGPNEQSKCEGIRKTMKTYWKRMEQALEKPSLDPRVLKKIHTFAHILRNNLSVLLDVYTNNLKETCLVSQICVESSIKSIMFRIDSLQFQSSVEEEVSLCRIVSDEMKSLLNAV